jgi:hypothetical protein
MYETKHYKIGKLHARFDSFGGLIPVKPLRKIIHEGWEQKGTKSYYIRVEVLETMSGYKKGEVLEIGSHDCIPLAHVKQFQKFSTKILPNFVWDDSLEETNNSSLYSGSF